jgi:NADH dehydrogenase FAD-containing subunit
MIVIFWTCGASASHLQQNGKLTQKQRAKRIQLKSYLKQTSNLGVQILKDCYVKEKVKKKGDCLCEENMETKGP